MANYLTLNKALAGKLFIQHCSSVSPFDKLLGVVSIGDPGELWPSGLRLLQSQGLPVLRLEFHDLDVSKPTKKKNFIENYDSSREKWAQKEDIQDILRWNENLMCKDGTIVVHCHAGACRSAAVTYIMLYQKHLDYAIRFGIKDMFSIEQSFQRTVESCMGLCWPNRHILERAKEVMDVDFLEPIEEHYEYVANNFQFYFI